MGGAEIQAKLDSLATEEEKQAFYKTLTAAERLAYYAYDLSQAGGSLVSGISDWWNSGSSSGGTTTPTDGQTYTDPNDYGELPVDGGTVEEQASRVKQLLISAGFTEADLIGMNAMQMTQLGQEWGLIPKISTARSGSGAPSAATLEWQSLQNFNPATDLIPLPGTNKAMIRQTGQIVDLTNNPDGKDPSKYSPILDASGNPTGYYVNSAGQTINAQGNQIAAQQIIEENRHNLATEGLTGVQTAEQIRNNLSTEDINRQRTYNDAIGNIAKLGADPGNFTEREYTIRGLTAPSPLGPNTYNTAAAYQNLNNLYAQQQANAVKAPSLSSLLPSAKTPLPTVKQPTNTAPPFGTLLTPEQVAKLPPGSAYIDPNYYAQTETPYTPGPTGTLAFVGPNTSWDNIAGTDVWAASGFTNPDSSPAPAPTDSGSSAPAAAPSTDQTITPEAQAFMDANPQYADYYASAGVPGYAHGTISAAYARGTDPHLTPRGTTTAQQFVAGDTQRPGVPNPEMINLVDPPGPNNAEARVTPMNGMEQSAMGMQGGMMGSAQSPATPPNPMSDKMVTISKIMALVGKMVQSPGEEKLAKGISSMLLESVANGGSPEPTGMPEPMEMGASNAAPSMPAYAYGTDGSYTPDTPPTSPSLASTITNQYGIAPQSDANIQNLPSISQLMGNRYGQLSISPTFQGAFGTQLPEARGINYGRYLDIRQDPLTYGLLSSLYRSGSRNLDAEAAIARRYAPIGNASRGVRT